MDLSCPTRPNGFLSRFVRDQRGVSAIIFALILPVLFGFVGVGVEIGLWYSSKRNLQAAADAGAMAGAMVLYQGGTWATAQAAASAFAVHNGAVAANVTPNNPPTSGAYTADAGAVEVLVTESQPLLFSAVFLSTNVTVNARAVATAGSQDLGCVVALESSAASAVNLNSNAEMNLSGCGLTANSSSATGVDLDSNAEINADFVRMTGNYNTDSNAEINGTQDNDVVQPSTITTGQTATADPYASLANPTPAGACTATNYSLGANDTATIGPGRYCGGFAMNSNANLTMTAGTYYIDGGTFSMNSNTKLYANSGVTIILTGSGADWAELSLNSNAYIQITAPTSGDYAGIAIMQDQDAPSTTTNNMNSNVYIGLKGAIYFPNTQLHMDSNATITTSTVLDSSYNTTTPADHSANAGCGLVVADTIDMNSNSHINLNNDPTTCDTAQVPTTTTATPSLVE